jgi:hypothetical protein
VAVVTTAFGQVDRATLSGTVTDPTRAVLPGARVEILSPDTGLKREVTTNAAGAYSVPLLPVGNYTVTVSLKSFATVTIKDVRLGVGDTRTLDVQLQVSSVETQVSIEGTATPLDSTTPALGTVIGSQQIREIPLNGRHWASLMALAPGAINTGDGSQQTIRFVGRSRDDNNWTFDGLDATGVKDPRQEAALRLIISTEAIAEFRVNASLYSAESGNGAGAQVNLVSKSGTNDFHGSLFEFFRNDKLDSRNPFDLSKQPFRLNQFGGSFGGPVIRNRTFFFGSYEGLRQRVSQTFRNDVPSVAFRTRTLAASPALRSIIDAYPAGTIALNADINRVETARSQAWREDSGTLRVDHRFNDNNILFGRYNVDDGLINAPRSVIEVDRQTTFFRPSNFVVQYQRIIAPTVINEAKAGFNRSPIRRFGYGPLPQTVNVAGFMGLNSPNLLVEAGTSYSILDSLAVMRGRHTLKTGLEARRIHVNVADPAQNAITLAFTNRESFVRNSADNLAITAGIPVHGARRTWYLAYVQDEFKVRPNLTLNLGLRYEYYTVPHEVKRREKVFDLPGCQGFCAAGTRWYAPDRNNLDPRIGLAWSPAIFRGRTVFRAGAGVYHGTGQNDDVNAALDNDTDRFSLTAREVPGLSFPIEPFLASARSIGVTPRSLQRDRRDLYSLQWGFSIQQQLPASFVTQIGYVASGGRKLFARTFVNTIESALGRRPLPAFGQIDEKRNDGTSNFNALQVSLQRQFTRGLLWSTQYMWSHSINDGNLGGGEGTQSQNVRCRACDRGNSAQDIRHTMTSNWVYQLPVGPGQRFWNLAGPAGRLVQGWEVSGIWTARTGRMLTAAVTRGTADLPDGNNSSQRPNIVPGVSLIPPGGRTFALWLNPAAFAVPARGTWGNAGRSIATGPGLVQVDVSLQKETRIAEQKSLVFRIEGFNLFNRTQAGDPGLNISTATFGFIGGGLNRTIGTGTSRQVQLALRFLF